jgi:hypothetical protein
MLRASLMAVVIGLICGLTPAQAQNGVNCFEFCRTNRCNGGMMTGGCMNKCVAICQSKHAKPK